MRSRQSNPVISFVLIVGTLVLGFISAGTVYATEQKKDICHIDGQGRYHLITIATAAYAHHLDHGDKPVEQFYIDADGDGFGSTAMSMEACTAPEGFVADKTDCDDTDAAVHPGATEIQGNGIDDDCDPTTHDVVCPCEGRSLNDVVWAESFTAVSCFRLAAQVLTLEGTSGSDLGRLQSRVNEGGGVCTVSVFQGDQFIGGGAVRLTGEGERACQQSIREIAANDGVTCPP